MTNTAEPQPPIIEWWRVALLFVSIAAIIWWVHVFVTPARAETIGYRLDIQACREGRCRPILPSPSRWTNQFACQARAATIEEIGLDLPLERIGLPRGTWTIKARCAPVSGMPTA